MDANHPANAGRPDWLIGLLLMAGCLAVYHVNGGPQPEVDCVTPPYTAWSLARTGGADLRPYRDLKHLVGSELLETPRGELLSFRPIGAGLAVLPVVGPVAAVREEPFSAKTMLYLGKVAASLYCAGAVAVFFCLVRRYAPGAAWQAAVLFALGTSLWSVASQAFWVHGPATFLVCLGLSLLLPGPARDLAWPRAAGAGFVLGLAVTTRPTLVFLVVASGLALLVARRWRAAFAFGLLAALPVLGLMAFQAAHFGNPFLGGYVRVTWEGRPPFLFGLSGLLVSPSRGLFAFTPALLLAAAGIWQVSREAGWVRTLLAAWLGAFVLTVWYYARWPAWHGGWGYGPRFFCEMMPLACLLVGLGVAGWRAAWQRGLVGGLIGLSVFIHAAGVFGHSAHFEWHLRHLRTPDAADLFEVRDCQIEAYSRAMVRQAVWGKERR